MSNRLDDIRARAEYPPDGWAANTGERPEMPEKQLHIITYYGVTFGGQMLAHSPATLVERADVLLLLEIAEAANALDGYEDFSDGAPCEACSPAEPAEWLAARRRLYDALDALRGWVSP